MVERAYTYAGNIRACECFALDIACPSLLCDAPDWRRLTVLWVSLCAINFASPRSDTKARTSPVISVGSVLYDDIIYYLVFHQKGVTFFWCRVTLKDIHTGTGMDINASRLPFRYVPYCTGVLFSSYVVYCRYEIRTPLIALVRSARVDRSCLSKPSA